MNWNNYTEIANMLEKHIIYVRNVWISTLFPKTSYNTQAGLDYHYDE